MADDEPEWDEPDETLAALAEAADERIHPVRPDNLGQKKTRQDTDGRIVTDVPCKGCDYNLRGQLPAGSCPECGYPIVESLKSEHLRFANLGWLRSLKAGLTWVIVGSIAGSVGYALFVMILGIVVSSRPTQWPPPASFGELDAALQVAVIMDYLVFMLPLVVLCFGLWLLTKTDPNANKPATAQALTRWSFLMSYGAMAVIRLYMLLTFMITFEVPDSIWVALGLIVASATALFVGFPAMMIYLRSLAERLPSRKLMRHTAIVLWGLLSCVAISGIMWAIIAFTPAFGLDDGVMFLLSLPMLLGVVVFSIWWLVLLFVYQGRISKTISSARRLRRASTLDPNQAHAATIDESESDD